jgi:hypothetical protein
MRVSVDEGSRYGQADIEAGSDAGSIRGACEASSERTQRDRCQEKLAIEVLTALGERDATVAATEQRGRAALQPMITDESLTVLEAVQWCAGAISDREAARLASRPGRLTTTTSPRLTARWPPTFDD